MSTAMEHKDLLKYIKKHLDMIIKKAYGVIRSAEVNHKRRRKAMKQMINHSWLSDETASGRSDALNLWGMEEDAETIICHHLGLAHHLGMLARHWKAHEVDTYYA
jgi:hypothetical protein